MSAVRALLVFVPISLALHLWPGAPGWLVFAVACLAILPLAGLMGEATEELARRMGPNLGGLLNATFGNAAELIITIFALRAGKIAVVQASIAGSIIGNILLVLGLAVLLGGMGRERQTFNRTAAGMHANMLVLSAAALVLPALFSGLRPELHAGEESMAAPARYLGLGVSVVLLATYLLGLLFSLKTHRDLFGEEAVTHERATWSAERALLVLAVATIAVAYESERLVHSLEAATRSLGLSEMFVGVIVIPVIGNAAEHASAVAFAIRDKMDVAIHIAIGSSTQVALFVAPVLVFLSLALGHPLPIVFHPFEVISLGLAALVAAFISLDGETNWLEGVQLLATYGMIALAFFFLA
ncbi:MAG: calcium/proton exchanger [Armatimonadetes bacterium]|nr:calcium/proton exchanger [Armatimonadota bacterium]